MCTPASVWLATPLKRSCARDNVTHECRCCIGFVRGLFLYACTAQARWVGLLTLDDRGSTHACMIYVCIARRASFSNLRVSFSPGDFCVCICLSREGRTRLGHYVLKPSWKRRWKVTCSVCLCVCRFIFKVHGEFDSFFFFSALRNRKFHERLVSQLRASIGLYCGESCAPRKTVWWYDLTACSSYR